LPLLDVSFPTLYASQCAYTRFIFNPLKGRGVNWLYSGTLAGA